MKKLIFYIMAVSVIATGCDPQGSASGNDNPLLSDFDTPYQTPPFDKIEPEHYMPAFEEGIALSREGIDAIINNGQEATFENTIEAMERNGEQLNCVAGIFFALLSSETNDQLDSIANLVQPKLTELSNDISLNRELFERVKHVYDKHHDDPALDAEQNMLLHDTYKGFIRRGANLGAEDQEKYRAITTELGSLSLTFSQNVLAETNAFALNILPVDSAKLEGLPEFVKNGMAEEARSRGEQGWTLTLQMPSYMPFMTFSPNRELKELLWKTRGALCYNDSKTGNTQIVKRVSELRLELARLLGYDTYADYVLEERMAGSRGAVDSFLTELVSSTKQWAVSERSEVEDYAAGHANALLKKELMPWDFQYFSEQLKMATYDLNQEEIKPYLKLDNVEKGLFLLADSLFGITFKLNPDIQLYHPDVKAYEVYDKDGSFLAILYMDYFPRPGKRGGAWMTNIREMYTEADGTQVRPLVSCNFNFTKPTGDTPSLLTFDELTTALHEFGHGLHGIMAEGRYASLTGTNVYQDFVELPSQLLENWATEKDFLDLWAVNYKTGEKMPARLVYNIIRAKKFLSAYNNVRQISFGMNDMAWHTITHPVKEDPEVFEKQATAVTAMLPNVDGICSSTSFSHIFAGGYAAGYYSYKWAEVLEADAFSLFEEKGILSREVGESFRRNILSKGGSENPMILYERFRGHKPEPRALIDKIGAGRE